MPHSSSTFSFPLPSEAIKIAGIPLTRPLFVRVRVPKVVMESMEIFDDELVGGAFFREDVVFGGRTSSLEGEAMPSSDTLTCPPLSTDLHAKDTLWEQDKPTLCQIINDVLGPTWIAGDIHSRISRSPVVRQTFYRKTFIERNFQKTLVTNAIRITFTTFLSY
jgi:hypothetical protein